MMTKTQKFLLSLVVVVMAAGFCLAPSTDVQAQDVAYYNGITLQPGSVQYHRVYQGSSWYWTPGFGWYRHDHYADVPYCSLGYYTYDYNGYTHWVSYIWR